MTQEQKPQANEQEVLSAITNALNGLGQEKYISQITMLGVLNALRVEQEHLFWETQMFYRQQAQQNATAEAEKKKELDLQPKPAPKLKIVRKKK